MQASLSMYTCGECNNGCGEDSSTISFQCGHYWHESCLSKLDVRQAAPYNGTSFFLHHTETYNGISVFVHPVEKCPSDCPRCTRICSNWVKTTLAGKEPCCRVAKNGGNCQHPHIPLRYSSQTLNPKRQRASKRQRDKAKAGSPASAEAAVRTESESSGEATTDASAGTQSPEESRFDFENAEACLHSLKNPMRMQNDSDADSPERRAANVTQSILLERHLTVLFEQSAGFTPQAQAFIRMSMSFDPEWPPFMGLVEASCVTNQTDAEALAEVLQKVQPSRLILLKVEHLTGQPPLLGHVAFQLRQDLFALESCEFHGLQVRDLPSVEAFLNRCQAPRLCTLCQSNFQAEDVRDLRQRVVAQIVIEVLE
mmetsp:Transcript_106287/g.200114  ORF Transcript_106287/g.200114 Transcript_106287/m.200114 type:complete len:369 (+) Transcript_106287:73-1179(+)